MFETAAPRDFKGRSPWLSLAIREPLVHVIPHLITDGMSNWQVQLEIWRLFVFLILTVRFYLGSGLYFDDVYVNSSTKGKYSRRSYPIDFLSGLLHFLMFFACAIALSLHQRIGTEISYFLALLVLILLYDNIWWLARYVSNFDTIKQIREWSNYNNLTTIITVAALIACRVGFRKDPVFSEHMAIFPVLAFSLYDIKQLMSRYEIREGEINQPTHL
ncbi:MAG: hypothetical protein HY235_04470 [Acidobacteria bacterium]|nr:hypothetical protein [Acidobacteriota bacterium]